MIIGEKRFKRSLDFEFPSRSSNIHTAIDSWFQFWSLSKSFGRNQHTETKHRMSIRKPCANWCSSITINKKTALCFNQNKSQNIVYRRRNYRKARVTETEGNHSIFVVAKTLIPFVVSFFLFFLSVSLLIQALSVRSRIHRSYPRHTLQPCQTVTQHSTTPDGI